MTKTSAFRPAWTPLTVGLMVLGFVTWWPLGLAMIAYILWGDQFQDQFDGVQRSFKGAVRDSHWNTRKPHAGTTQRHPTPNSAFNEYRREEIGRLEEERKRLDDDVREFEEFLANLRHARDKQEFDRFMHARNEKRGSQEPEIIET